MGCHSGLHSGIALSAVFGVAYAALPELTAASVFAYLAFIRFHFDLFVSKQWALVSVTAEQQSPQ